MKACYAWTTLGNRIIKWFQKCRVEESPVNFLAIHLTNENTRCTGYI